MAWFKLNDSLNTLKGQISNVSNVVQEVFAEAIIDEDAAEPVVKLEDAVKEIDNLTSLCNTKDSEIIALRRQIQELQQQKNAENTTGAAPTKSNADQNAPPIEDSWFWDPEPNTASSSSKDHSSKSGSGGDLTTIPLDHHRGSHETIEKLRSVIDDKDQQLKNVKIENAILNEKINQLSSENREVNSNIDELDRQHEAATERLIDLKDQLEHKLIVAQKELDVAKADVKKFDELSTDYEELKVKYANVEKSYTSGMEENLELKNRIQELNVKLEKVVNENVDLMSSSEEREKEIIDKLGFVDIEKEKDQLADVENYKQRIAELDTQLKELDNLKVEHQKIVDELNGSKVNIASTLDEMAQLKSTISNNETVLTDRDNEIAQLKKKYDQLESSFNEFQEDALIKEMELGREKNSLGDQLSTLDAKYQSLMKECDNLKSHRKEGDAKYVLQEEFENLKTKASESETKLVEENVVLQKEILDLQSCIKNQNQNHGANVINSEDLRSLIKKYVSYGGNLDGSLSSWEEFFRSIGDTFSSLDTIEKSLNDMTDELKIVLAEKKRVEHEKETIQADLHHYEIEVGELMKNNEVLLTEIEHLKSGKLETISEHNEDSIISLEKQLEDCSNLNQSLEDEYQEIRDRLEEVENAKEMLEQKLQQLTEELQRERETAKDLTFKLENLDAERSNLLFEINELKADDSVNALELTIADKNRAIDTLERQFKTLNQDHSELIAKLQSLQAQSLEMKSNFEGRIAELQNDLSEKDTLIEKKEQDVLELIGDIRSLKTEIAERSETGPTDDEQQQQERESLLVKLKDLESELSKIQEASDAKQTEIDSLQHKVASSQAENEKLVEKLNEKLSSANEQDAINQNVDSISKENESLKLALEGLSKENSEFIALITAKHNENVQYHTEIQRLSQLLTIEVEKHRECNSCVEMARQLSELQENNQSAEKLNDQIAFLKEKSDILTQNLLTEQMNQKLANQERLELIEEKNSLAKDLERLRQHLLDVEENHMMETVELQQVISETKSKMSILEEEAKKSNNAYTSASIRANQHTETLQTQYQLLTQQRDELLTKLSAAEDKESRNEAALINLQCALEQFQNNKDRDVESVTYRLRKDLENEARKQVELQNEIKSLHGQLLESKNGLLAASRITDQLESCQVANATLKAELRECYDKLAAMEKKLIEAESCHADKIEKGLLKNLLIGYIVAPNQNDKLQILKLISSVLSFTQTETDKVGLNKAHTSWLNSLLAGGGGGSAAENENYNKQGLAEAFVKFLEKESQPRTETMNSMSLLNIVQKPLAKPLSSDVPSANVSQLQPIGQQSSTTITAAATAAAATPAPIQPILVTDSILQNFAPPRNSSSILKDILNDS